MLFESGLPGLLRTQCLKRAPSPRHLNALCRTGGDRSSSGGSADTRGKLPAGGGGGGDHEGLRRRRLQRLPLGDGDEEGEDEMMQEEGDEDLEEEEEDEDEDGEGLYDPGRHHNNILDHAAAMAAAAAGLPLPGAGRGGGGAKRPAGPKQPKQPAPALGPRKYVSSQITVPILEQEGCFNMTQVDAARHLGFGSSTVLKKASGVGG
jgi:hypothetical protein